MYNLRCVIERITYSNDIDRYSLQNMVDIKLIYDPNVYVGHKCGCNE